MVGNVSSSKRLLVTIRYCNLIGINEFYCFKVYRSINCQSLSFNDFLFNVQSSRTEIKTNCPLKGKKLYEIVLWINTISLAQAIVTSAKKVYTTFFIKPIK